MEGGFYLPQELFADNVWKEPPFCRIRLFRVLLYPTSKELTLEANFMTGSIITLYNVCAVPWGVLSTVGGVQYRGGYHEYRGGIS